MSTTSGSEGSAYDLYLENLPTISSSCSCLHQHHHNCHGDINCISDDTGSTRSTCCTNLRWSSASSERAVSETYSNSLNCDLTSTLTHSPHVSSSQCNNPYFQNYDIPKSVQASQCSHTVNESRMSNTSNTDDSSTYNSYIFPFRSNRDLELCGEENYENSSVIYSHVLSSSSTTSSNSSGGPTYAPAPLCTSFTSTMSAIDTQPCYSVVVKRADKERRGHHQEKTECSSESTCSTYQEKVAENERLEHHYQVPRTAIANLYLMVRYLFPRPLWFLIMIRRSCISSFLSFNKTNIAQFSFPSKFVGKERKRRGRCVPKL